MAKNETDFKADPTLKLKKQPNHSSTKSLERNLTEHLGKLETQMQRNLDSFMEKTSKLEEMLHQRFNQQKIDELIYQKLS
jgi:mevalonate kinase